MQWDDIRYFVALKRFGNLTAAARELGIRHSTVSRRVDALEQRLGIKLFDRLPRGWVATAEAEQLWPRALEMERQALALSRTALNQAGEDGCVRVAGPPVLLSHFLVPRLASAGSLGGLQVHLISGIGATNLAQGEADVVLRVGLPVAQTELLQKTLSRVGYGLYGTIDQVDCEASARRYLGFDQTMDGSAQSEWLEASSGGCPASLLSNDLDVLLQAARVGWGLAVLPHFLARQFPELVWANPQDRWERELLLLVHPDVRRAPRVRRISEALDEIFYAGRSVLDPVRSSSDKSLTTNSVS